MRIIETETKYLDKPPCKTAEQMEKICCEPTAALQCCTKIEPWDGYTDQEALDRLGITLDDQGRDADGNYVVIEFLPREKPCGVMETRYDVSPTNCCDEIEAMTVNEDLTTELVDRESSGTIAVNDGSGQYIYTSLSPHAVFSNGKKTVTTTSSHVQFMTDDEACGSLAFTVSDGCTEVFAVVRVTEGTWEFVGNICGPMDGVEVSIANGDTVLPAFQLAEAIRGQYKLRERFGIYQSFANCGSSGCVDQLTCNAELAEYIAAGGLADGGLCLSYKRSDIEDCVPTDNIGRCYITCEDYGAVAWIESSPYLTQDSCCGYFLMMYYKKMFATSRELAKWVC